MLLGEVDVLLGEASGEFVGDSFPVGDWFGDGVLLGSVDSLANCST